MNKKRNRISFGSFTAVLLLSLGFFRTTASAQLFPDIMINRDLAGTHISDSPQIICDGDTIHVVWEDRRNGLKDIYYNSSPDGGKTWLNDDIRLDVGTVPGSSTSLHPQIAISGNTVYVVWRDDRRKRDKNKTLDSFPGDIYMNCSSDRGRTWQPLDFRVNRSENRGNTTPRIAAVGDAVYVLWEQLFGSYSVVNADLFINVSHNRGGDWQPEDLQIDDPYAGLYHNTHNPALAAAGDSIYVAWEEYYHISFMGDIYFIRSPDRGGTWDAPQRIRADGLEWFNAASPQIEVSGGIIHLAWLDARDRAENVYHTRSLDDGRTWESGGLRLNLGSAAGSAFCYEPRIAASGDNICVVWRDNRNDPNQDEYWYNNKDDIFANTSDDGGETWMGQDFRVNIGDPPGDHHASSPVPAMQDGTCRIVWIDRRNGLSDIYCNQAWGGGCGTPARLDTGDNAGAGASNSPTAGVSYTAVHAVWVDFRENADYGDIYYNRMPGSNLPLRIEGEKVIERSLLQTRRLNAVTIRCDPVWTAEHGPMRIQLLRKPVAPDPSWTLVSEMDSLTADATPYYDVTPDAEGEYIYQARAVDAAGHETAYSSPIRIP